MDQTVHKRKRRACDQCRKSKSRCEDAGSGVEDDTCRNCLMSGHECTYLEPIRKRGPPKGYMSALEQRLSNAEALLGALVCSNDPRATSIVSDLSEDTLASSILSRIREGGFGLSGRIAEDSRSSSSSRHTHRQPPLSSDPMDESLMSKLNTRFDKPSIEWQDCLNFRLALGLKKRDSIESSSPLASSSKASTLQQQQKAPEEMLISDALQTARVVDDDDDVTSDNDGSLMQDRTSDNNTSSPVEQTQSHRVAFLSYRAPTNNHVKHQNRPIGLVLLSSLNIELDY